MLEPELTDELAVLRSEEPALRELLAVDARGGVRRVGKGRSEKTPDRLALGRPEAVLVDERELQPVASRGSSRTK
jgi:hypothetical protein